MNYILDTCVVSELTKPDPDPKVVKWISSQDEESLYLSSITIGEIQRGISKLSRSRKKTRLQKWLDSDLTERFEKRILGIGISEAKKWGEIQAAAESSGIKMPVFDGLIAAIACVHNMAVVTRNVLDMQPSGIVLINPWE